MLAYLYIFLVPFICGSLIVYFEIEELSNVLVNLQEMCLIKGRANSVSWTTFGIVISTGKMFENL